MVVFPIGNVFVPFCHYKRKQVIYTGSLTCRWWWPDRTADWIAQTRFIVDGSDVGVLGGYILWPV